MKTFTFVRLSDVPLKPSPPTPPDRRTALPFRSLVRCVLCLCASAGDDYASLLQNLLASLNTEQLSKLRSFMYFGREGIGEWDDPGDFHRDEKQKPSRLDMIRTLRDKSHSAMLRYLKRALEWADKAGFDLERGW